MALKFRFLKCLLVIFLSHNSFAVLRQDLHNFMTGPELGYYLGAASPGLVPEYEIVYLPLALPREAQGSADGKIADDMPINYKFDALGRNFDLKLRPNRNLISPNFKMIITEEDKEVEAATEDISNCHYLHESDGFVAALSMCNNNDINGLLFMDNSTYEIKPLNSRISSYLNLEAATANTAHSNPHIIRRNNLPMPSQFADDFFHIPKTEALMKLEEQPELEFTDDIFKREKRAQKNSYTVEVALFFDEPGYDIFAPYLKYNDKEMRNMLLAYMNGVQALYHHPSLGTSIEIALVRLEIMKKQPLKMPHYDGERSMLLDSFCSYQKSINPPGDANPDHWDMGLYVSGLDFYAMENGRKSGVTMGLAAVGGVCMEDYACVITELGTTNVFGKPYPSAGFTSVYILAHEIGHNLGMHHDNSGNPCPKDGYIMSPSRGTNGETTWSTCSAEVMRKLNTMKCLHDSAAPAPPELDHGRFGDAPGQAWGAKRQCEFLLRDRDAAVALSRDNSLGGVCQQLQCRTPHRSGFYYAGPALEGTDCGRGMWCEGGQCVKLRKKKPAVVKGGWSPWKDGKCTSGCIVKGTGFYSRSRSCNNPTPVNTEEGCEGSSFDVNLCQDDKVCMKKKRTTVEEFASKKCKEFSKLLPELDTKGAGLQAPHESGRLWMGCAIFCKRGDSGTFYTPRIDLNDLGVDPYFPDGTWCHNDGDQDFYCLQHHCLPASFKFTKRWIWELGGDDVPWAGNARTAPAPPALRKFLSLDEKGRPLARILRPGDLPPLVGDQDDIDYIELPPGARDDDNHI